MVSWAGSEKVGPKHHRRTAVEHFAGIDVSLEQSSVCVVDATGKIVREAKVASEPEGLVRFFRELGVAVSRIGLEAGYIRPMKNPASKTVLSRAVSQVTLINERLNETHRIFSSNAVGDG